MQIIPRHAAVSFAFDHRLEPSLTVEPGERFKVETQDTACGQLYGEGQSPFDRSGLDVTPPLVNPLAGPVAVSGVRKGDLLCISIHDIDVSHSHSITYTTHRGPLKDSAKWPQADEPRVKILRHEVGPSGSMRDGRVHFDDRTSWPADPFIGTIGVAPEREILSSQLGQGAFGGNIDCRHIRAGSKLYVTAQVDGGMLFLGDLHAGQGDMEFTGVAAETEGTVELSVAVVRRQQLAFPRIETEESFIALCLGRPADHALTQASFQMIEWLSETFGMAPQDVYLQLSVNPLVRAHVYQMLPQMALDYVVGVEFPKSCVPNARQQ